MALASRYWLSPMHTGTRVFWGLVEGIVAAVLLSLGGQTGLEALQQASIATGVPLAILFLAACWALVRAFRQEEAHPELVLQSSQQAETQAARQEVGAQRVGADAGQ